MSVVRHHSISRSSYLKLGLEQRFGVLKSGSLFSAPGGSFLGESCERKLNFLGKDLEVLGDSASMRSTQD